MSRTILGFAFIGCCGLLISSGCGPDLSHLPATVTAEGVVTLDGKPIEGAMISFISPTTQYHATAQSDAQGRFSLKAFNEKPGAVPGNYALEVNKTVVSGTSAENTEGGDGAALTVSFGLPKRYASMATSRLKAEIPATGTSDLKIELTSK